MARRVASVRTFALKVPSEEAYLGAPPEGAHSHQYFVRPPWRSLYSHRYETLLVRLETNDGYVGWGETLAPVAPEVPQMIIEQLLVPFLLEVPLSAPRPMSTALRALMRERGHLVGHQADALAACDIALWDLAGHIAGLPVCELLGGAFRSAIPTYVSGLPRSSDADRVELASEWVQRGAQGVKLALGYGVDSDLATFDAIASACPDLRVAVDAHWAYTTAEAERFGVALDQRHAWFLEAPLVPEDIEGHRSLAQRVTTPIAVGEALRNRYEFGLWLARHAVDLCQPDIARTGISEAIAIATLAETHHVRVAPHHSVGFGVALAAGLQFAAATESLEAFEYQPTTLPHANQILTSPLLHDGSAFSMPDGPGLGVMVAEQTVIDLADAA